MADHAHLLRDDVELIGANSPCSGPLLGAAIPRVAVACASRSGFMRARDWILARTERVRRGFAMLLGAMGVTTLTGADKRVEARVLAWLPDAWVNLTIGI